MSDASTETHPSDPGAPSPAPVSPRRRSLVGRVVLGLVGVVLLAFVLLLPYRARIAFSDALGRSMNAAYGALVGLVRWFIGRLQ